MKSLAFIAVVAALAGASSAQVTYNETTGEFFCPIANGAYCASNSLAGPIIIRCTNGVGQPGNCDDNLDGEFPQGVNYSPCWESSTVSGDAACSKNCVVYGGSGAFNGTFTLSNCTPIATSSSSLLSSTSIASSASSAIPTLTSAFTLKPSAPSGTAIATGGSGSGGSGGGSGVNGTATSGSGGSSGSGSGSGSGSSATATPVGPSSTTTGGGAPEYTGAAVIHSGSASAFAIFGGLAAMLFL